MATISESGLTFGQIIALLALAGGMIAAWTNINIRVKAIEVDVQNLKAQRLSDINIIEVNRKENREEHSAMIEKLDSLIRNQISFQSSKKNT